MSAADVTQELDLLREAAEATFGASTSQDKVRRLLFEPDKLVPARPGEGWRRNSACREWPCPWTSAARG